MNHHKAPLWGALLQHHKNEVDRFHVPGHKGRGFAEIHPDLYTDILKIDQTEVGALDDLHAPDGVIEDAQILAADAFGADHTFFLVGGTTAGNLAAILAVCSSNDIIIVQRNSHQSIYHACLIAEVRMVFLESTVDPETNLEKKLDIQQLEELLNQFPTTKAVVITSPDYYGQIQPVAEFVKCCHRHHIPLLVDEAHGAHLGFHPALPLSALQQGADIVTQSTHKMLCSMTMSSMLHIHTDKIDPVSIQRWLRLIESSSPSYPLMASLDLARRDLVINGPQKMNDILKWLTKFRAQVKQLSTIYEVYQIDQDPFKFTLASIYPVSGYQIANWLEQKGIYTEMADHCHVLFAFGLGTQENALTQLIDTLIDLDREVVNFTHTRLDIKVPLPDKEHGHVVKLQRGSQELLPLDEAEGRVAAELIVPYPPGVPVLVPGEKYTQSLIQYLCAVHQMGGKVRGIVHDHTLKVYVLK
ncbi:aminotransferase class V-fold PLP-dependent enzyme [Hazenella sp. IB182353]|uniref:aminotransferase class I/II-fold pyridoxal phosphate-dependent enzyme n=1 Tax=Polycladospora coralii TaxID=2771432 RepID=UPI001745E3EE|nr:aminotransferase class V-fold PLP-dependent enzyme [Polycladospora coralii]MBS7531810.1 aminotransferase class V-fold PLP-dependent enzyme [Polycladospora coralii]